ncbi:MAG: AI-2E family transporter [Rhizomicrobium sp.]
MTDTISALVRRGWTEARVGTSPPSGPGMAISFAIAVVALYFGRDIFVRLALAILLSFVLAPLVLFLRRVHFGRVVSVVVAVALAFIVIFGIGSLIGGQLADLAKNVPQYQSTINRKIQFLHNAAAGSGLVERASSMLSEFEHAATTTAPNSGGAAPNRSGSSSTNDQQHKPIPVEIHQPPPAPLQVIRNIIGPLSGPLATTGIVIIFVIFILLQREDLRDRFIRLAGRRDLQRTTRAVDDAVRRLSRYFLMLSVINAVFGTLIGIGLFFIGVPNPVLWGILAMLLRFIPYIGAPIAAFFRPLWRSPSCRVGRCSRGP